MPNIIDTSLFVGDRAIANKEEPTVHERLQFFIDKYEPLCLQSVFGKDLYAAYVLETIDAARFNDIIYGDENVGYAGFKQNIVDYVYFWYMRDAATQTVGIAVVIPRADMAYNVSPAQKLIDAWNSFSKGNVQMAAYIHGNKEIYPEYTTLNYCLSNEYAEPINEFDI